MLMILVSLPDCLRALAPMLFSRLFLFLPSSQSVGDAHPLPLASSPFHAGDLSLALFAAADACSCVLTRETQGGERRENAYTSDQQSASVHPHVHPLSCQPFRACDLSDD